MSIKIRKLRKWCAFFCALVICNWSYMLMVLSWRNTKWSRDARRNPWNTCRDPGRQRCAHGRSRNREGKHRKPRGEAEGRGKSTRQAEDRRKSTFANINNININDNEKVRLQTLLHLVKGIWKIWIVLLKNLAESYSRLQNDVENLGYFLFHHKLSLRNFMSWD